MLPYEQDWYPHALASPASTPSCAPMSKPGFPLTSKPRKLLLFYSGPNSLAELKPAIVWKARNPPSGQKLEDWAVSYPPACVGHTVWPDGQVYAQLRNFCTLKQVTEFAWKYLRVEIREAKG